MNESKQPGIDGVQENEINLFELLYGLWRKRSVIFAFTALATVLILCAGYYVYATRSVFDSYQLTFRLVFAGAEKGEYPNGEPFNQSDIMSPSILEQVFQINDLANVYPVSLTTYTACVSFLSICRGAAIEGSRAFQRPEAIERYSRRGAAVEWGGDMSTAAPRRGIGRCATVG